MTEEWEWDGLVEMTGEWEGDGLVEMTEEKGFCYSEECLPLFNCPLHYSSSVKLRAGIPHWRDKF